MTYSKAFILITLITLNFSAFGVEEDRFSPESEGTLSGRSIISIPFEMPPQEDTVVIEVRERVSSAHVMCFGILSLAITAGVLIFFLRNSAL